MLSDVSTNILPPLSPDHNPPAPALNAVTQFGDLGIVSPIKSINANFIALRHDTPQQVDKQVDQDVNDSGKQGDGLDIVDAIYQDENVARGGGLFDDPFDKVGIWKPWICDTLFNSSTCRDHHYVPKKVSFDSYNSIFDSPNSPNCLNIENVDFVSPHLKLSRISKDLKDYLFESSNKAMRKGPVSDLPSFFSTPSCSPVSDDDDDDDDNVDGDTLGSPSPSPSALLPSSFVSFPKSSSKFFGSPVKSNSKHFDLHDDKFSMPDDEIMGGLKLKTKKVTI